MKKFFFSKDTAIHIALPLATAAAFSVLAARIPAIEAFATETAEAAGIRVFSDGECITAYTRSGTVSEILEKSGVSVGQYDKVYPDLDTVVAGDVSVFVSRASRTEDVIFSETPYETETRYTEDLDQGVTRVVRDGINGKKMEVYEVITYETGEKVCSFMYEMVSSAPVNKIVEVGTGKSVTLPSGEKVKYTECISVKSTAYTTEKRPNARTATGTVPKIGTIAVDPKVIPLGTKVYITSADGSWSYGVATAEDTGGKILGNRIDLYFNTTKECIAHGVKNALVYILK